MIMAKFQRKTEHASQCRALENIGTNIYCTQVPSTAKVYSKHYSNQFRQQLSDKKIFQF